MGRCWWNRRAEATQQEPPMARRTWPLDGRSILQETPMARRTWPRWEVNSAGNHDGEMNMAAESEVRTCGSGGYVGHICFFLLASISLTVHEDGD